MSGHEDVLRHAAELEELAKAMLNKVDALRTAHCRAIMRQSARDTASPRVVAGPLRLWEEQAQAQRRSPEDLRRMQEQQFPGAVLTHASCAAPCGGFCPDDEPPGAA